MNERIIEYQKSFLLMIRQGFYHSTKLFVDLGVIDISFDDSVALETALIHNHNDIVRLLVNNNIIISEKAIKYSIISMSRESIEYIYDTGFDFSLFFRNYREEIFLSNYDVYKFLIEKNVYISPLNTMYYIGMLQNISHLKFIIDNLNEEDLHFIKYTYEIPVSANIETHEYLTEIGHEYKECELLSAVNHGNISIIRHILQQNKNLKITFDTIITKLYNKDIFKELLDLYTDTYHDKIITPSQLSQLKKYNHDMIENLRILQEKGVTIYENIEDI